MDVRDYFWTLNYISLIHVFIPVPVPHHIDYVSLEQTLKLESMSPPTLFFLSKIILVSLGPFHFHRLHTFKVMY